MQDFPLQTVLQQRDARPVTGEHLEVLGKHAAAAWGSGSASTLHDAVVNTVRSEHLSPEQVCRVVEFTNQAAYLDEFQKAGSDHRVVHFQCGPADPAQVLQDLNDGGGGSVYDAGLSDYRSPPMPKAASAIEAATLCKTAAKSEEIPGLPSLTKVPSLPKSASERAESEFWGLFGEPSKVASDERLTPLVEAYTKLADACTQAGSALNSLENELYDTVAALFEQVKQASQDGHSLAEVVTAWSTVESTEDHLKLAFAKLTPMLRQQGVFSSYEQMGASLTKSASAGEVNPQHPLVTAYSDFVETVNKLAATRELQAELGVGRDQALDLMKRAEVGGLLGAARRGVSTISKGIDTAAPAVARVLVGPEAATQVAPTLAKGLKATGAVGGLLAGNAAIQSVTDRPAARGIINVVSSTVPGTGAYQERRYRNMMGQ